MPATAEEWFESAQPSPGSWWPDWQSWMGKQNGPDKVAARTPGDAKLKVLGDAPGSYAMLRLNSRK